MKLKKKFKKGLKNQPELTQVNMLNLISNL
jgi:hypothetical protein